MDGRVKTGLAVLGGIVFGSVVNMGLITLGSAVVPAPAGVDTSTMEGLKAGMALFGPQHFVFPFLAHAGGTLAGALLTARLAVSTALMWPMVVAGFFLVGGVANSILLPAPVWFVALDLVAAYLPMGWLAWRLVGRSRP